MPGEGVKASTTHADREVMCRAVRIRSEALHLCEGLKHCCITSQAEASRDDEWGQGPQKSECGRIEYS